MRRAVLLKELFLDAELVVAVPKQQARCREQNDKPDASWYTRDFRRGCQY